MSDRSGRCSTTRGARASASCSRARRASLLDIDHGTYPYRHLVQHRGGAGGGRLGPRAARDRLCARHRQGLHHPRRRGPVPDRAGQRRSANCIGERGREFGTVTGRKRRCGWFDAVLVRQTVETSRHRRHRADQARRARRLRRDQGLRRLRARRQAHRLSARPPRRRRRASSRSTRASRAGRSTTAGARSWAELPAQAIKYVRRIEELIECPVALLSTSPERDDTILVKDPFED